ncbi:MAG TPA: acyltransferase [Vicinamibacterales bacterium]|nr:acyltransferase [Vicinamibacterales bacterium]
MAGSEAPAGQVGSEDPTLRTETDQVGSEDPTLRMGTGQVGSEDPTLRARTSHDIPRAQEQLFAPGTSSREKYAKLVIGRSDLASLLWYEVIVTFTQSLPGALGLALRKALYPSLLGSCGRNVVFGQNVTLRHPHKIHIADNVAIDDNCLLDAKGDSNAGIRIGSGVFIGRNTILSCKNGDIEVADGANIGFNCELFSASTVRIGSGTLLAAYTYVIGGDHDFSDPTRSILDQERVSSGVLVGAGAWIGAGAKIMDGVSIGDKAIIGAGAVVTRDIPAQAVAVGIPAKVVSNR